MALTDDAQKILGRPVIAGAMDVLIGDLNERLRVREMEEVYLTEPAEEVPLPSYFREAIEVRIDDTVLSPVPLSLLAEGHFSIVGDSIRLKGGGTKLSVTYRASLTTFEEETTNRVASAYSSLFLYGLLTHHATLVRDDDGISRWTPRYEDALRAANQNDTRARQSEMPMRPAPRYCA